MPHVSDRSAALSTTVARLMGGALAVLAVIALVGRYWVGAAVLAALAGGALWWAGRQAGARRAPRRPRGAAPEALAGPVAERQALAEKLRGLSEPELREHATRLFRRLGHRIVVAAEEESRSSGDVVLERGEQRILMRSLRPGPAAVEEAREFVQVVAEGQYDGGYAVTAEELPPDVGAVLGSGGVTVVGPERLAFLEQSRAERTGPAGGAGPDD